MDLTAYLIVMLATTGIQMPMKMPNMQTCNDVGKALVLYGARGYNCIPSIPNYSPLPQPDCYQINCSYGR